MRISAVAAGCCVWRRKIAATFLPAPTPLHLSRRWRTTERRGCCRYQADAACGSWRIRCCKRRHASAGGRVCRSLSGRNGVRSMLLAWCSRQEPACAWLCSHSASYPQAAGVSGELRTLLGERAGVICSRWCCSVTWRLFSVTRGLPEAAKGDSFSLLSAGATTCTRRVPRWLSLSGPLRYDDARFLQAGSRL